MSISSDQIIGKQFHVTYDPEDAVRGGQVTQLKSNEPIMNDPNGGEFLRQVELQIMRSMLSRSHDLPGTNLAELFPEVPTTKIEDFFTAGWTLKQEQSST